MNQLGGFPLLTLIVFLPALSAVVAAMIPGRRREVWRWLTFLSAAACLFIALFLYMGWSDDDAAPRQFVDGPLAWSPTLGIDYYLGIDGINLHLVMMTALLTPLALLLAWAQLDKGQAVSILVFETGALGALTALNLVLFFAFWLIAMLSMFFLFNNDAQRSTKSRPNTALLGIAAVSAAIAIAVVIAGLLAEQTGFAGEAMPDWPAQAWMFWTLTAAMLITGAAFPFHIGLTDAQRDAPAATKILAYSLLTSLGGYGLIRFCLLLFPLAAASFAPAMIVLGAAGLLYGAFASAASDSLDETLAYWHVAQMGLGLIGIFMLQALSIHGAVIAFVARGLGLAALWICHSDPRQGTGRAASWAAFASLIGIPGLAGFAGQLLFVLGMLRWHWQADVAPAINVALDWGLYGVIAAGLLIGAWALARAWPRARQDTPPTTQTALALPILVALLIIGLRPQWFSDTIGPSIRRLGAEIHAGIQNSFW